MPRSVSPILILNPAAGRAPGVRRPVGERARSLGSGARLVETEAPGHAEELARAAADEGHDRIVAIGGDGTIQEVVNGLLRRGAEAGQSRVSLAIVPAGRGDDLARSLGLSRRTDEALRVAIDGTEQPMDVIEARGAGRARIYVSAAGAGFDAQVAAAMAGTRRFWQRGAIGYFVTALAELRRFRNRPMRITLETLSGEQVITRRALMVAVTNGAYYGGGMWICPDARTDDGLLDLCIVGDISRLETLRQMPGLYRGGHVRHPAVEFRRASSVTLEAGEETGVHLDGELFGTLPVTLATRPAAIRVVTHDHTRRDA